MIVLLYPAQLQQRGNCPILLLLAQMERDRLNTAQLASIQVRYAFRGVRQCRHGLRGVWALGTCACCVFGLKQQNDKLSDIGAVARRSLCPQGVPMHEVNNGLPCFKCGPSQEYRNLFYCSNNILNFLRLFIHTI